MKDEESVSHFFVPCSIAYRIWYFFPSHRKISWSFLDRFQDLIMGWRVQDLDGLPSVIWHMLPNVICWGLWLERNARTFKDKSRSHMVILNFIFNLP